MEILLLSTSAQHTAKNENVILDPKSLLKWIDKLPIMNLPETVRLLHTAIESLNELMMDDKQRLKLIEIYYDSLQDILVSYDEMRISMLQIEVQQRNILREDIMWLYLSLASGYKLIIKNLFEKGVPLKKDTSLLTIYTAMELIIEGLVYGFSSHQTPPPLARLEINQLYALVMHYGLTEKEVKGAKGHERQPTISRLYKQYILLIISNPYRLNSSDVLELFLFLEPIVDECIIELNGSPEPPEGKFIIELNEDVGPVPCNHHEISGVSKDILIIDVWPIIHVLGLMMSEHQDNKESIIAAQEKHMIEIVIEQLERKSIRKTRRELVHIDVQLAMGIEAVHYCLSAQFTNNNEAINYNNQGKYEVSNWVIKNRSENGCMLEIHKEDFNQNIVIGDIVSFLIKTTKIDGLYKYAIVRWVRHVQTNSIQIGVELLPNKAFPILYKMESSYGVEVDDGMGWYGLYFPSDAKQAIPESILINKEEYKHNQSLILENGTRKYRVNITALLLNSPLFIQLKFKKKAHEV